MQVRAHRSGCQVHQLGDLVMPKTLDVVQDQHLSRLPREAGDAVSKVEAYRQPLWRAADVGVLQRVIIDRDDPRLAASAPAVRFENDVHGEAVHPGTERRLPPIRRQPLPGTYKGIMCQFLRKLTVAGHAETDAKDPPSELPVELLPGVLVSSPCSGHELWF